jgi:hypothetical protein
MSPTTRPVHPLGELALDVVAVADFGARGSLDGANTFVGTR